MADVTRNPLPQFVTSLPAGYDGQEVFFQSTTAGTGGGSTNTMADVGAVWRLRYRSAATGSYKWEFVGGSALYNAVDTSQSLTAGSGYQNLATVGPIITAPVAGVYNVQLSCLTQDSAGSNGTGVSVNDAAPATDLLFTATFVGFSSPLSALGEVTLTSGQTARIKYERNSTSTWSKRRLRITPIRVG